MHLQLFILKELWFTTVSLLGAGHGQHHRDGGEGAQGEAPPVPATLEQNHRLAEQPRDDGQRGDPDQ